MRKYRLVLVLDEDAITNALEEDSVADVNYSDLIGAIRDFGDIEKLEVMPS